MKRTNNKKAYSPFKLSMPISYSICAEIAEKRRRYCTHQCTTKWNCAISPADELKKYKELLDIGVISQDEFDEKKK